MVIPKIVHQIWIGNNIRPDIWMNTVRDFCVDFGYEYRLWNESLISNFAMRNQKEYDSHQTLYGKADILRYEILYEYGGIFIDADSVILKPEKLNTLISDLKEDCGFGTNINYTQICNGVILSIPKSFIMNECIKRIPFRDFTIESWRCVGPELITDIYKDHKDILSIKIYPEATFFAHGWYNITTVDAHKYSFIPEECLMFQYGYSTNGLQQAIIDSQNPKIPSSTNIDLLPKLSIVSSIKNIFK